MKVTTKGQVTIPQHIRRFLGISAYSHVEFEIRDDEVVILKGSKEGDHKSGRRFKNLRGLKKGSMTTAQWLGDTRGD